jgi:hypothetical protein
MPERRYQQALRRFKAFRSLHPNAPVTYYATRPLWLA